MRTTHTDHGDYTEELWEPDDKPGGKANGGATPGAAPKIETKTGPETEAKVDVGAWPVLDEAAYHGLAGDVVKTILPHTESDPVAMLLQFLVCFGNAVGRQPYCIADGAEHYPVLYVLLAGPTAKARKGTSAQRVRPIFKIAASDWVSNNIASGISSGEGILHAIRDPVFGTDAKTGLEVLVDAGVTDKRVLFDEREFSSVLDRMRREGNSVETIIREAWDCPIQLRTTTKQSPTKVTGPHVSITAHVTIEELRQKLNQTSMANGFANRFLFACVRRSKELPFGGIPDKDALNRLSGATLDALAAARMTAEVTMTELAAEMWVENYPKLTAEVPGLIGAITARSEAQTLRLALLYALLDRAQKIDVAHLKAALAVWNYCEASARFIFGDTTGDPLADTILRLLRSVGVNGASRMDITNPLGRNTSADRIDAALSKLLDAGKARFDKQKLNGPGRPREMWFAISV